MVRLSSTNGSRCKVISMIAVQTCVCLCVGGSHHDAGLTSCQPWMTSPTGPAPLLLIVTYRESSWEWASFCIFFTV